VASKKEPLMKAKADDLNTLVSKIEKEIDQALLLQATMEATEGTEPGAEDILKQAEKSIASTDAHIGASKEGLRRFGALLK
jgi:hypothetical protein